MGLLSAVVDAFRPSLHAGDLDSNDERLWQPSFPILSSAAGVTVTPTRAFQVSCFFQGVRLYAETLGSLPLILYRERDDGGKDRARTHRLWNVLRRRPNPWQTAQEWRETMTAHALAWGTAVSEIKFRARRVELWPLDPDTYELDQLSSGRLRAVVTEENGTRRTLVQDQMFRIQGVGVHRFMGASLLHLCREAIGLWLAQERFNAHFFSQGARPGMVLEHPGKLKKPTEERIRRSLERRLSGLANAWRVFVAEEGMKLQQVGFSARDSQLVEARQEQAIEMARWLNLPVHMLRAGDQPPQASAEVFAREFVDYSMRPWATRWEQSFLRDLIADDDVFAEFLFDGLLRGNHLDRARAYALAIMNGWMAENEVRKRENLNPWPGLDEPRRSVNQDRGGDPRDRRSVPRQSAAVLAELLDLPGVDAGVLDDRKRLGSRRLRLIARQSAARVVRRELAALRDKAPKMAARPEDWREWLSDFYGSQATLIADALQLEPALAQDYAERHHRALLTDGLEVAEEWEEGAVEELTALALEEEDSRHAAL